MWSAHIKKKQIEEQSEELTTAAAVCTETTTTPGTANNDIKLFYIRGLVEQFAFTQRQAEQVITLYGAEQIKSVAEYVLDKGESVNNPGGLLMTLLKEGFVPPARGREISFEDKGDRIKEQNRIQAELIAERARERAGVIQ